MDFVISAVFAAAQIEHERPAELTVVIAPPRAADFG
jgi:hypothetical protein